MYGASTSGSGVYAYSNTGNGLKGSSYGASNGANGGNGVYGYSPNGQGIGGESTIPATASFHGGTCGYTGSLAPLLRRAPEEGRLDVGRRARRRACPARGELHLAPRRVPREAPQRRAADRLHRPGGRARAPRGRHHRPRRVQSHRLLRADAAARRGDQGAAGDHRAARERTRRSCDRRSPGSRPRCGGSGPRSRDRPGGRSRTSAETRPGQHRPVAAAPPPEWRGRPLRLCS